MTQRKHWYDYLWICTIVYFTLGFFNIMFAWLGLISFFLPLLIAIIGGSKAFCNRYCDRGQFFSLLGGRFGLSRKKDMPRWLKAKGFRYGFLIFFFIMFFQMLWNTYLVFAGADLHQTVKLFWTFKVPWHWAYHGDAIAAAWVPQFAFGFYGIMLTSTLIGLIVMVLFKPRSWCVFCPMGTMTQLICRGRNRKKIRAEREGA